MNAKHPTPAGINAESVPRWLTANIAGAVAPFHFDLIAGGHSNLTFSVTDSANHHYVLRRPPLSHALASAHDMGREHRVISALQSTKVPVAPTLAMCDDTTINDFM
jgi:aminoglycoside phosphotransferase (APT) family kinase protein